MSEDHAGWLHELPPRERRLVCAFRNAAIALGRDSQEHRHATEENLARITREADRSGTLRRFWSLMGTLGSEARRTIRYHVPACPCLGVDEAAFLSMCRHLRAHRQYDATCIAHRLVAGDRHARALVRHAAVIATRTVVPEWSGRAVRAAREPATPGAGGMGSVLH